MHCFDKKQFFMCIINVFYQKNTCIFIIIGSLPRRNFLQPFVPALQQLQPPRRSSLFQLLSLLGVGHHLRRFSRF